MPNERLVRQALLAKPTGKQPRCRPSPGWSNCISDLAWSRLDVEPVELSEIAIDVRYSRFACGCCPHNFPWIKSGHENELNEYLR